jgi:hypothetical protein
MVSCGKRMATEIAMVFVTTTSYTGALARRSTAGPESSACEAQQ